MPTVKTQAFSVVASLSLCVASGCNAAAVLQTLEPESSQREALRTHRIMQDEARAERIARTKRQEWDSAAAHYCGLKDFEDQEPAGACRKRIKKETAVALREFAAQLLKHRQAEVAQYCGTQPTDRARQSCVSRVEHIATSKISAQRVSGERKAKQAAEAAVRELADQRKREAKKESSEKLAAAIWSGDLNMLPSEARKMNCSPSHIPSSCIDTLFDSEIRTQISGGDTLFGDRVADDRLEGLALKPLGLKCDIKFEESKAHVLTALMCAAKEKSAKARVKRLIRKHLAQSRRYRSPEGFGRARWGMTRKQTSRAERVRESAGDLVAPIEVAGITGQKQFMLHENRLVTVRLQFSNRLMSSSPSEFLELRALLSKKYGEPDDDYEGLHSDEDIEDLLLRGRGSIASFVSSGDRDIVSIWKTEETLIVLRVSSRKRWMGTSVTYGSRALWGWHLREQARRFRAESQKL